MRYANRWEMPEVTFYEVEDHGFTVAGSQPTLYAYGKPNDMDGRGIPKTGELYASLDRAMVAWVAEKYTGPRGAGGPGVGTAADWFLKMIGADEVVPVNHQDGQKALVEVLAATAEHNGPTWRRARAMGDELEARGLVLAAMNHGR